MNFISSLIVRLKRARGSNSFSKDYMLSGKSRGINFDGLRCNGIITDCVNCDITGNGDHSVLC